MILHHGQTQQYSFCLRTTEKGCEALGNGENCEYRGTRRTKLNDNFDRLEKEDNYRSLKSQYDCINANKEYNPTTDTTENAKAEDWKYEDINDLSVIENEQEKDNKEDDLVKLRKQVDELSKKVAISQEEKENMSRHIKKERAKREETETALHHNLQNANKEKSEDKERMVSMRDQIKINRKQNKEKCIATIRAAETDKRKLNKSQNNWHIISS